MYTRAFATFLIVTACNVVAEPIISPDSMSPSEPIIQHFNVQVYYDGENWIDNGVLMLPYGYNINANNTDLIVYCHSGGGSVFENSSECEEMSYNKYLVSRGYAILSMAAMPIDYAEKLVIDRFRTVGSEISIRCVEAGVNFIRQHNHFSDKLFLLSNSNGGLLASNLVNLTKLVFKAQCGIAPLLSIELNAWNIPSAAVSGGRFHSFQNRANIISIYGMTPVEKEDELLSKKYEKEKVGKYDPFDYFMNSFDKPYPIPYLIFSCKNDEIVYNNIAYSFAEEMNKRGGLILIDTTTSLGAHNVDARPIIEGEFTFNGETLELNSVYNKIDSFFTSHRD